jgi:small GTP-binding protein
MLRNSIKIVFVGDPKVGKTSMVKNSIEADSYEERNLGNNESLINPILIHNESMTSNMNIILIDTSSNQDRLQQLISEIKNADSIILVYDMSNEATITNLSKRWLPLIKTHNPNVPVLLIGNKLDLVINDEEKYVKTKVRRVIGLLFKDFKVRLLEHRARNRVFCPR